MTPRCRFCRTLLKQTLVDLGTLPLANSYPLTSEEAALEPRYPLHARVCGGCFLVQVDPVVDASAIFTDYLYFSSVSETWSAHAQRFAERVTHDLRLGATSHVLEVASNDGYLLRHFRDLGVPVLGVEPAANVAAAAAALGVSTVVEFFDRACAARLVERMGGADLVIANNVLAHVPDLNDFVAGLATVVKPAGVLSLEFPHLLNLIEKVQFDTIYHEHYSYFSLLTVERIFMAHGLTVFDVEQLPTHGGSLRVWAAPSSQRRTSTDRIESVRRLERRALLDSPSGYQGFSVKVQDCRRSLRTFLAVARSSSASVAAYAAAAKGNTLLNYCGVGTNDIVFVADRSPHKQGRYLPGSHLPIVAPERIAEVRPNYLLVLAWNLRDEICWQMAALRDWGGRFVSPIPEVEIA